MSVSIKLTEKEHFDVIRPFTSIIVPGMRYIGQWSGGPIVKFDEESESYKRFLELHEG